MSLASLTLRGRLRWDAPTDSTADRGHHSNALHRRGSCGTGQPQWRGTSQLTGFVCEYWIWDPLARTFLRGRGRLVQLRNACWRAGR